MSTIVVTDNTSRYRHFLSPLQELDAEMYEFITAQLTDSYAEELPIKWLHALKLPAWLNSSHKLVTKNGGYDTVSHTSEHWLLRHDDGSWSFPDIKPTKGTHICEESKRIVEVYNNAPQQMPPNILRAIKITIGAHDNGRRGVSWTLYSKHR